MVGSGHRVDPSEAFKELGNNWEEFKASKRVIIHLASVSLTQQQRSILQKAGELNTLESHHFGRLCDIRDANVDVILITRSPVGKNLLEYYDRLLRLLPAIRSGKAGAKSSQRSRYLIVVPEAVNSFDKPGCPPFCLSSLLKYSPRALQSMKAFIKGRPALVVPGAASHIDDYYVADYFAAALLAPSLQTAKLFNAKTTIRRVVSMLSEKQLTENRTGNEEMDLDPRARLLQAPGDYDVYEEEQFYETLAQLITANLPSRVYAFKIDFSYNSSLGDLGAGGVPCWSRDIRLTVFSPPRTRHLSVPREFARMPARSCPNRLLPRAQNRVGGGVIEAMPPAQDWTNLSIEVVIYPDKSTKVLCSGDQLHAGRKLSCWGWIVPMTSVDPAWVNKVSRALIDDCASRGLKGYFTIDLVTFFHEESAEQLLWITGIRPGYSANLAMFQLVGMLADADFVIDAQTGTHQLLATPTQDVGKVNPPQEKNGSAFTLFSELKQENLGIISVGNSLPNALRLFINHLKLLHTEINCPKMQGQGCISDCIRESTSILELSQENVKNAARRKQSSTTSTDAVINDQE
ncbi:unnamed protein product [Dibothriocephalus latus]|uniref:IQCH-like ATP-grasp domain-containing protein n=1 Tax=Dibothriocephalus latus TaxID=60516 RepID=A0A3P6TD94_DIBLA|nr:unnamed protein product [Dibothriocephalus latus]